MAGNAVDFISLIKDVRGNQFDPATGLPTNGKWFDIKGWHTAVTGSAAQVSADLAAVVLVRDSVVADISMVATKSAEVLLASADVQSYKSSALVSEQAALLSATSASVASATAIAKATESTANATLTANYSSAALTANTAAGNSATAAAASATTASAAVTAANAAKVSVLTTETNVLASAAAATTSATNASGYSSSASGFAATATAKATEATTQRDLAANWAVAAVDTTVNDGVRSGYSAYHWSVKAAGLVASATGGTTSFIGLADVPLAFTGAGLKYLRVNAAATGIEFDALTKADVGLTLVENTADIDKGISSATQTALNGKSDQSALNAGLARVTTLEGNTTGVSVQPALGLDPIRLFVDKPVYSSAAQVLSSIQNTALTTFALLKSALAAETIGTY